MGSVATLGVSASRIGDVSPACFAFPVSESRHGRSSPRLTLGNRIALASIVVAVASLVIGYLNYQNALGSREAASPSTLAPILPTDSSVAAGTEPPVRHRNRIELRPGETPTANLDAPQSSADWSFDDGSPPELRFIDEVRLILDSGEIVTTGRRAANYATCRGATGYERRSYEDAYLIVGDSFCVRTSEGRIATFRFVGARPDLFTVDAVVYEPQLVR